MTTGELEKLRIRAYSDPELSTSSFKGEFIVMMNPEGYALETKMEFNFEQGQGTTANLPRFQRKPPEELAFDVLFDDTGIIDGKPNPHLARKIQDFSEFLMGYDSETHEPKFFEVLWGTSLFKGRCVGLASNFKLFKPDGSPSRATCRVSFKAFQEDNLRVAETAPSSPDLTHVRVVQEGDTLPLMCFRIYGDDRHYLEVARSNRLLNFRRLVPGQELYFPPFARTPGGGA